MQPLSLIPYPAKITETSEPFELNRETHLFVFGEDLDAYYICRDFNILLRINHGILLQQCYDSSEPSQNKITWRTDFNLKNLGEEGYRLIATMEGISITACKHAGLSRAAQTLMQLIQKESDEKLRVPGVEIEDYPRFTWRGMHLDVARHYFSADEISKFIHLLGEYKLNMFHLHLTDDQGWRIEIKQYPRLTEVGAWRRQENGSRYGGFYSQEEIRKIVHLAREHNITIVPEIDLPGHATAALAAYPQYSCTGESLEVENRWGIFNNLFCPGKEETYQFLQDVLSEIIELFPGEYIHVGGDECPFDNWENCPDCQRRIRSENLSDTHELFSYFMNRIALFLASRGSKLVGWDEILEGDLHFNSTIMVWRDPNSSVTAAQSGHDVVMSPTSHCYFDYYQADAGKPEAIEGLLPLNKVYEFEPVPASLSPHLHEKILGGQANVWTEYMPDFKHVEYMTVPRLCALAEVLWSPVESRNFDDFIQRLKHHYARFDRMKVNYRRYSE
jgi:hexosaminidase